MGGNTQDRNSRIAISSIVPHPTLKFIGKCGMVLLAAIQPLPPPPPPPHRLSLNVCVCSRSTSGKGTWAAFAAQGFSSWMRKSWWGLILVWKLWPPLALWNLRVSWICREILLVSPVWAVKVHFPYHLSQSITEGHTRSSIGAFQPLFGLLINYLKVSFTFRTWT